MDTKTIILDSFVTLIKKYSFDDITVQMILNEAKVSRSTFYRFYSDKYDLMNGYYRHHTEGTMKIYDIHDYVTLITDTFTFVKENKSYFKKINKIPGHQSWVNFQTSQAFDYYCDAYKKATGDDPPRKVWIQLMTISVGGGAMLARWVDDGCPDEPSDLAHWLYEMLPPVLKKIIEDSGMQQSEAD